MIKRLFPLLAASALLSCSSQPNLANGRVHTGTVNAADGTPIVYDVRGSGPMTLVFVHCWAGNRTFWKNQLDTFAQTCKVVSLDLPGHGESGRQRAEWSIVGYGEDVARVVTKLDLGPNTVLVGHSMGGPVCLAAAGLLRGRVRAVVGVDTLHDVTKKMPKQAFESYVAGFRADFAAQMRGSIRYMYGDHADSEAGQWLLQQALHADPVVATTLLAQFPDLDQARLMRECQVPVRCIQAAPSAKNEKTNVAGNRELGDFDAVFVEDVGHFLLLEAPDRFNLALAQVLLALPRG